MAPIHASISVFPVSQAHLGCHRQHSPPSHPEIRQCEEGHQRRAVLGQATITDFRESELALDDTEWMFNLGSNAGLEMFKLLDERRRFLALVEQATLPRAHGDVPTRLARGVGALLGALITRVAERFFLVTVQQRIGVMTQRNLLNLRR